MSGSSGPSGKDRRRAKRLSHMEFRSFVQLGNEQRDCVVTEVSETGARIGLAGAADLPDEFILHLSGQVPRRCTIVWRKENAAGVRWNWHGDPSVARTWRAIFRESDI
jgi:hypothetical protein